jgi:hypothetical protein
LEQKRHGEETSRIERSEVFESFLAEQLTRLKAGIPKNPVKCPADEFDRVFKTLLAMNNQQ